MSAHGSHTFDTFSAVITPDSHPSTTLLTPNSSPIMSGLTPPPSPSPFMRTFYASQPPPVPSPTNVPNMPLAKLLLRIRKAWREDRHLRRFFLLFILLLPTLFIAAYLAGAAASYRNVPHIDIPNLERRQVDSADAPVLSVGGLGNASQSQTQSPTSTASTESAQSGSVSLSATPTTTRPTTAPSVPDSPVLPTPFVQPFDLTLSTDFDSASCQIFFANLTQSLPFRQCRPFSLLLPTSQGFLAAQSNLTLMTSIIYGTCSTTTSKDDCVNRMDIFAIELKTACVAELADGHAMAWDALNGMKNYAMMREAACLRNQRTNAYCFAEALAATPPSDIYFYQLPLGTPLPGTTVTTTAAVVSSTTSTSGTSKVRRGMIEAEFFKRDPSEKINITPTCSACTQSLMGIYASYATNSSLLISGTYTDAQRAVDESTNCGSGYASAINAATGRTVGPITVMLSALVIAVVAWGL